MMDNYFEMQEKGDAGTVALMPLLFTIAIVSGINRWGYENRWCYKTVPDALAALNAWDGNGEPTGWHRHPDSGRRRDASGIETINR